MDSGRNRLERTPDEKETYFGGKSGNGTYQTIINQIPPCSLYVEGFAGGAGIFKKKRFSDFSILIEIDPIACLRLSLYLESIGFYLFRVNGDEKFFINKQSQCVSLINTDFFEWIGGNRPVGVHLDSPHFDSVLYLDPPYPKQSRKSPDRNRYRYELSDTDHVRFLDTVNAISQPTLISTYPNNLYKEALNDWRLIEFQSTTHAGLATEWLFCNFPEPAQLHDYRFVGKDRRGRLDFHRLKARWVKKFNQLSPVQKHALLKNLTEIVEIPPSAGEIPSLAMEMPSSADFE